MARELYNWDQVRSYSIIALYNVLKKEGLDEAIVNKFINKLDSFQTLYGKEGVIGLAQRYLKKIKDKILEVVQ